MSKGETNQTVVEPSFCLPASSSSYVSEGPQTSLVYFLGAIVVSSEEKICKRTDLLHEKSSSNRNFGGVGG